MGKMIEKIKNSSWVFYIILFDCLIFMLYFLISWNTVMGACVLLLIIVNIFIGSILKAFISEKKKVKNNSQKQSDYQDTLNVLISKDDKKRDVLDLESSNHMLRYATAILSFLSLLTTGQGMKDFVFDKEWLAYLASFAVQAILVVFSMLLCRLYIVILGEKRWPMWGRRLAVSVLTIFFGASLMVSSVFSFSYISNNAYRSSWPSDSDIIIENYLIMESHRLQVENERRGDYILKAIKSRAQEDVENVLNVMTEDMDSEFRNLLKEIDINVEIEEMDYDFSAWYNLYPSQANKLTVLESQFQREYENEYNEQVKDYKRIMQEMNIDDDNIVGDLNEIIEELNKCIAELDILYKAIDFWKDSFFVQDVETIRGDYRKDIEMLKNEISGKINELHELLDVIDEKENIYSVYNADALLSDIYSMDVVDEDNIDNVILQLDGILLNALQSESFTSDKIEGIVELYNLIGEYKQYLELRSRIETYSENNLGKTYIISVENELQYGENGDGVNEVELDEWKQIREMDFYDLINMVKALPETDESDEAYIINRVIGDLNSLRRDLLGDLTDMERAFLYFKYDYRIMAIFSAFIAIFLDMGAFLTGVFIYMEKYLEKSVKTEV